MHIIEDLTNQDLTSDTLEKELYDVLHQRDDVQHDAFDEALKTAKAIDLEPGADKENLLDTISHILERDLAHSAQEIRQRFLEREEQGSCMFTPFVAIPHIVVDGEGLFEILLVRSRDRRNMHLKALAAIAHIVQHQEFEHRWSVAKNEQQLKDILLLAERVRM